MPVSLLLAVLPAASLQEWTALDLPAAALERGSQPAFRALLDGRHILIEPGPDARPTSEGPLLPPLRAVQLLESEARRASLALELFQGAPPLLARGGSDAIEWASAVLREVDAAAARAEVQVHARLVPVRGSSEGGDVTAPAEPLPEGSSSWSAGLRSGDSVALGERQRRSFIANFDVEVATDSGVAAPVLGRVEYGETLHLRACRLDGGRRIALEGLLDLAELSGVEDFDPGTPDLGVLEQPLVHFAHVAFSGVIESGGTLRIELYGLPLAQPDWTLWLQASCAEEPRDARPGAWQLADLALISEAARTLPPFPLGADLDYAEPVAIGGRTQAVSPGGLVALIESARRGARAAGAVAWPSERFVLLPAAEPDLWRSLGEYSSALESGRGSAAELELRRAELLVRLPIAAGSAVRVAVGSERTWLVDYTAQIAPDVWMPSPIVERGFEGLVFQAQLEGDRLSTASVHARTEETSVRAREHASLGALQIPARSARGARSELEPADAAHTLLAAAGSEPAVSLRFMRP